MHLAIKPAIILAAVFAAATSVASDMAVGKVVYAGVYGNGDVYVELNTTINEAACPQRRFDVSGQNPSARSILATAYAAMASGRNVRVTTLGCFNGFPTLDNSRATWFLVDNP